VTTETLQKRYPYLFDCLVDQDVLMRDLIVVDENDEDIMDDDISEDLYDPSVYSHVIYFHAPVVQAMYSHSDQIQKQIRNDKAFEDLYVSEQDLWGVVTRLDEDEIALRMLDAIETILTQDGEIDNQTEG